MKLKVHPGEQVPRLGVYEFSSKKPAVLPLILNQPGWEYKL
jgi:hypothetical protein